LIFTAIHKCKAIQRLDLAMHIGRTLICDLRHQCSNWHWWDRLYILRDYTKSRGEDKHWNRIFFNAHPPYKGGDKTSGAVIVPGTMIGSGGEISPIPSVIRALCSIYTGHFHLNRENNLIKPCIQRGPASAEPRRKKMKYVCVCIHVTL